MRPAATSWRAFIEVERQNWCWTQLILVKSGLGYFRKTVLAYHADTVNCQCFVWLAHCRTEHSMQVSSVWRMLEGEELAVGCRNDHADLWENTIPRRHSASQFVLYQWVKSTINIHYVLANVDITNNKWVNSVLRITIFLMDIMSIIYHGVREVKAHEHAVQNHEWSQEFG